MNSTVLAVLCFTKMTEGGFKRKGGGGTQTIISDGAWKLCA